MPTGAITGYIDVAQIVLYLFWAFFAGLIIYLRREDKREGYPLESDRSDHIRVQGFPAMPPPKVFALAHGGTYEAPHPELDARPIQAEPVAAWPGAPLAPVGDPMEAGVGPGSWAQRSDEPERTVAGVPRFQPMRVATDYWVEPRTPDPRGMAVVGADGEVGGTVSDLWVDLIEQQVRYLEVELSPGAGGRHVLLPMALAGIDARHDQVHVQSLLAGQLARVPATRSDDQVSQLEEEKIAAYYASGHLYATPARQEPLL